MGRYQEGRYIYADEYGYVCREREYKYALIWKERHLNKE